VYRLLELETMGILLCMCDSGSSILCVHGSPTASVITINVPVVFMARYVMILRGATSL
jgi:hypothetical protein